MFLTLRSKILAGYLFVVALLAALGLYAVLTFQSYTQLTNTAVEKISQADRATLSMYESLVRLNEAQLQVLGGESIRGSNVLSSAPTVLNNELSSAEKSISEIPKEFSASVSVLLTQFEIRWHQYQAQLPEFLSLANTDPQKARRFFETVLSPTFLELKKTSNALSLAISQLFLKARDAAVREANTAEDTVIITTGIAIVMGLLGSMIIARRTTRPLQQLSASLKHIQKGNLGDRLEVRDADELGEVSFEFNRMAERLERYERMNIDSLLAEKSKSESVILSFDEPLFLFDAAGKLLLVNRSSEELIGKSEATMIGLTAANIFTEPSMQTQVVAVLEDEKTLNDIPIIIERSVASGRKFYRVSTVQITAPTSEQTTMIVGKLLHFTDITHFEELDRLKNDFLAKVSHEFRTPLTSIRMALDILAEGVIGPLTADQRELIISSTNDSERLAKLIKDLLSISKLDQSKKVVNNDLINVSAVLTSVINSLLPQYKEKNIQLIAEYDEDHIVLMNREHFESVVQNLLVNSLKYTPVNGKVSVSLSNTETGWTLKVTDTGIGIATADLGRIFDRFVQLKPTDAATPGSIGLGLAIVKEIVELYRGTINVESTLGSGSVFTIQFPKTMNVK